MRKCGMTRLEATYEWVREFNALDQAILKPYVNNGELTEVTVPKRCDRVYVYEVDNDEHRGEITGYNEETGSYTVLLDSGKMLEVIEDDFEVERDDALPMWGTMWSFGDGCDDWWLEERDGIRIMSECGFRIYEHEELGYFFGIDGAGYDFYEAHWLPLYNKRGLQWHDVRTDDLENCDEESKQWMRYILYLHDWAIDHSDDVYKDMSPASFNEWLSNECKEAD